MRKRNGAWLLAALLVLGVGGTAGAVVTFDMVPIGDPGNTADGTGFGAVAGSYQIGRTEVTNALDLYAPQMQSDASGGINFVGANANGSKYVVKTVPMDFANKPVVFVSFIDALRFVNWLHNGQGASDTESGAYALLGGVPTPTNINTVGREPSARFFLPSEDEWYKAAYFNPAGPGYFPYPFADGFNGAMCEVPAGTTTHSANCASASGNVTDVGSYTASPSPYGTLDQGGNVFEWNEAIIGGSVRGIRGGNWDNYANFLAASFRSDVNPASESGFIGFRVASPPSPLVPALSPGSVVVLGLAFAGVLAWKRRA